MSYCQTEEPPSPHEQYTLDLCADLFDIEETEDDDYNPVSYFKLAHAQTTDTYLQTQLLQDNCPLTHSIFCGGEEHSIWIYQRKVNVPTTLQKRVVEWYHMRLLHPGYNRSEATIGQHFWWPKMRENIRTHVKTCPTCQKNKENMPPMGIYCQKRQKQHHGINCV